MQFAATNEPVQLLQQHTKGFLFPSPPLAICASFSRTSLRVASRGPRYGSCRATGRDISTDTANPNKRRQMCVCVCVRVCVCVSVCLSVCLSVCVRGANLDGLSLRGAVVGHGTVMLLHGSVGRHAAPSRNANTEGTRAANKRSAHTCV